MMRAAPPPADLAGAMRLLALDVGLKRTGVAVGNRLTETAQPVGTLRTENKAQRLSAVREVVAEWQPDALIVGRPCYPDGQPHDMTRVAEKFARQLAQELGLPVALVDERYTSVQAECMGAADVDSAAACLILQRFFTQGASPLHPEKEARR